MEVKSGNVTKLKELRKKQGSTKIVQLELAKGVFVSCDLPYLDREDNVEAISRTAEPVLAEPAASPAPVSSSSTIGEKLPGSSAANFR